MFKKSIAFMALIPLALCLSVSALEAEETPFQVVIDENTSITVVIPAALRNDFSDDDLQQLIDSESLADGNTLTIHDVVVAEAQDSSAAPRAPYSYETIKSKTRTAVTDGTSYFIISVAKGETRKLIREFDQSVSTSFQIDTPFSSAGMSAAVRAKYTTFYEWTFPDTATPTANNSREFRCRFYYDHYDWTQIKHDDRTGNIMGTKKGTAKVPVKYASYSIDSRI